MSAVAIGPGGDAPMVLGILWGLTGLTFIFVVLRLWTRIKVVQGYGMDDHFFNASFLTFLIYDVMLTISSFYGFGRDTQEIIAAQGEVIGMASITRAILYSAIGQTILVVGTVLSKTSLALFLVRLVPSRNDKIAIWVPDFFLATAVVASLFVFWFSCQPTMYLWDRRVEGECPIDPGPISVYAGSWSVIVDFWYAAFPWYMLSKVNIPGNEKWLIAASMSLGVFAGAAGIKRAIELQYLGSPNYLKDIVGIIVWHAAELCTTMVCIGIPVCRPLYRDWFFPSLRGSKNSGSGGNGSGSWFKMGKKSRETGDGDGDGDGSAAGIFALHTIGGSEFPKDTRDNKEGQGSTAVKSMQSRRTTDGVPSSDDDDNDAENGGVALRNDIASPRRREVTVTALRPSGSAKKAPDNSSNSSQRSILGEEGRGSVEMGGQRESGIRVKTEFKMNST